MAATSKAQLMLAGGRNPPLVIDSDAFAIHFVSDDDRNEWGYRFVAWARPPTGWCRAAELMLSEAKECDRLVRLLIDRSPAIRAYAAACASSGLPAAPSRSPA